MRRMSTVLAWGSAVALVSAGLAFAQPKIQPKQPTQPSQPSQSDSSGEQLINSITPEQTVQILKSTGFTNVEIYTDNSGKKHVKASGDGFNLSVVHQNCKSDGCPFVTYIALFTGDEDHDVKWMNAWNSKVNFVTGFVGANGNLGFSMDVHFWGGVKPEFLGNSGKIFLNKLAQIKDFDPSK